jgi:hypothetical protein
VLGLDEPLLHVRQKIGPARDDDGAVAEPSEQIDRRGEGLGPVMLEDG